jgi:hypothetical protein
MLAVMLLSLLPRLLAEVFDEHPDRIDVVHPHCHGCGEPSSVGDALIDLIVVAAVVGLVYALGSAAWRRLSR